ncbi:RNA 2',3'-cyclic phosphodiesterase [uncultured Paraglaciecola sp.]|uniref:RNA 2',3'-cyclic phosphodiesterase n=1 Tax=uncultured Paraglaciecola sp. TaxID=1765024 RepID=UPI0030DAAAEF|tara:strand:- start:19722 stop:20273 length:552 start_codon:yes stop_codon:yes gene_type:complete
MRAFLGLAPHAETKLAIEDWRNKAFPGLHAPVPKANFHITLAFLGNVSIEQLVAIKQLIDKMPRISAFDVSLTHLGYWSKPKAFWLGCRQTANEHLTLAKQVHQIAKKSGLQLQQQEYVAHLTLARKCKIKPPAPLVPANFHWHVDQFHLFESKSSSQGVYYPILESWHLDADIEKKPSHQVN